MNHEKKKKLNEENPNDDIHDADLTYHDAPEITFMPNVGLRQAEQS